MTAADRPVVEANRTATYVLPQLTDAEWEMIRRAIPRNKAGPAPRWDRQIISALAYAEAARVTVARLPPGYPPPDSIRTRAIRWQRAGALDPIMAAAVPAIERIRFAYRSRLIELSERPRRRAPDDPEMANLPRLTYRRVRPAAFP